MAIHLSEELQEKLLKKRNCSSISLNDDFVAPSLMKDEYAEIDEVTRQKTRDAIIREVITRGLLNAPSSKEIVDEKSPDQVNTKELPAKLPPTLRIKSNQAGDEVSIVVDKNSWKMSVPREKETEREVTVIFNRKQSVTDSSSDFSKIWGRHTV